MVDSGNRNFLPLRRTPAVFNLRFGKDRIDIVSVDCFLWQFYANAFFAITFFTAAADIAPDECLLSSVSAS
ncbi:MAG: hypothetical protein ACTXOO_00170 [Sodalis sp. (in: enterobacteria)]